MMPGAKAFGPDTGNVHAVSVHTHLTTLNQAMRLATERGTLTLNHDTSTIPGAKALIHRSTPYGADQTNAHADAKGASSSNPMAIG